MTDNFKRSFNQMKTLGLIAGMGELPKLVAEEAKGEGIPCLCHQP